jgi:orotate phosphoribosyltransferase
MTSSEQTEDFVGILVRSGVLLEGDFELKSGRRSPYFVDFGNIRDGGALADLGRCYARKIAQDIGIDRFDVVFGPAYKAIPIAVATAIALFLEHQVTKQYGFNRKVEKTYGEKSRFLGSDLAPGSRVLIVDDVITDGGTKHETIDLLKEHADVEIVGVVVGVDRTEDASVIASFEQRTGVPLTALCTIADVDAVVRGSRDGTVVA